MFGKLLTNQKIAHKIVKPYVYKALREGLKTHDNGKIQNLRGFDSLFLQQCLLVLGMSKTEKLKLNFKPIPVFIVYILCVFLCF